MWRSYGRAARGGKTWAYFFLWSCYSSYLLWRLDGFISCSSFTALLSVFFFSVCFCFVLFFVRVFFLSFLIFSFSLPFFFILFSSFLHFPFFIFLLFLLLFLLHFFSSSSFLPFSLHLLPFLHHPSTVLYYDFFSVPDFDIIPTRPITLDSPLHLILFSLKQITQYCIAGILPFMKTPPGMSRYRACVCLSLLY